MDDFDQEFEDFEAIEDFYQFLNETVDFILSDENASFGFLLGLVLMGMLCVCVVAGKFI